NHPFFTLDGWKHLSELKAGDRIASPALLNIEGDLVWNHEAILLGWTIAEGNTCHPCGFYLYSNHPEAVEDMVQAAKVFPETMPTVKLRTDRQDVYDVYIGTGKRGSASPGRSGARLWLEHLGIVGQKATEKHFPKEVFRLNRESLKLLLGRYWSGDGFIAGKGNFVPYVATSSKALAGQLQHLLLRLGMVSRVQEKHFNYKEGRTGYTVQLLGRRSIEHFVQQLSPYMVGRDEQIACLKVYLEQTAEGQESLDTLPPQVKLKIKSLKEAKGITWRELEAQSGVAMREFYGDLAAHKKGFRRKTIQQLAEFFEDESLKQLCEASLFWESILSIEAKGEVMTYDLEIAQNHNFVANDLIVHNSHAAAYSQLSYQTAYLKAHYPIEFVAALLSVERANSDKVAEYVSDAKHIGVPVLSPDINESRNDFTPLGNVVRFGLYGIKNVGDNAVEHILNERKKGGKFKDLYDFCQRIDSSVVSKRALEYLIKAGAFDRLGERHVMLANYEAALKWGAMQREQSQMGQMSLFGMEEAKPPTLVAADSLNNLALLKMEKEALGIYISDHPMNSYTGLAEAATTPIENLEAWYRANVAEFFGQGRPKAALSGIMQNISKRATKSGSMMASFQITDTSGSMEVVAFNRVYEEIAPCWQKMCLWWSS
ncbi:MAG: LAGLIDADG family homing endonuclease, partial [Deinococcales bacterium]